MFNKSVLELLAKQAHKDTNSKKTSDIFFSMLKIAQSDSMFDEMLDLPNKRIRSLLSEPGKYEYKTQDIRNELQKNLNIMSAFVISKAKNEEISEAVGEFMPVKFIESALNQLEKYNGANANDFSLKGLLNGALSSATRLVEQRKQKQQSKGESSLEMSGVEKGDTFKERTIDEGALASFNAIFEEGAQGDVEDKETALEAVFNKILRDEESDILSIFIAGKLYPAFKDLKQRLSGEITSSVIEKVKPLITQGMSQQEIQNLVSEFVDEDSAKAQADFDKFYTDTFKFIKDNYGAQKLIPGQKGQIQEFSLREVQDEVNRQLQALDLNKIIDYIFKQNFYKLPKWATGKNQELTKDIIKSIIKSELIINAKQAMKVSLPGIKDRPQGGRAKLSQIDIVEHVIMKRIKNLTEDEAEQSDLISETLKVLGSKVDPETKQVIHKPKDMTQYRLFQHTTPMMMAAYMQKASEEYGEKFSELSDEEQQDVIEKVQSAIYRGGKLPYTFDVGANELRSQPYHLVGEDAENLTRKNVQERLQQAMGIRGGRLQEGGFMKSMMPIQPKITPPAQSDKPKPEKPIEPASYSGDDTGDFDEDFFKGSNLAYMIKKYAFKR